MVNKHLALPECQEIHYETKITMAEIKKDLNYIKDKLDENTNLIHEVIKDKADKEEVSWLKKVVYGTAITLLGLLGSGLIYLFKYWIETK